MTWLVTGAARATLGSDLSATNSTSAAFEGLSTFDRADSDAPAARSLNRAIQRATDRWEGTSDDAATPLVAGTNATSRPLSVTIQDQVATADQAFVAVTVPPDVEELELLFYDDGLLAVIDADTSNFHARFRLSDTGRESYVLVDAFVGASTTRLVALQKVSDGLARVRVRVRGQVAVLVAAVLRVTSNVRTSGARDVTWGPRLRSAERDHGEVARRYPRLEHAPIPPHEVAVFVHGTLATCLPAVTQIGDLAATPLYRFEHDTMRPIAESVEQLVTELQRVGTRRVQLLGHSRGGLVATLAGAQFPATAGVLTFGTPHCELRSPQLSTPCWRTPPLHWHRHRLARRRRPDRVHLCLRSPRRPYP